jgi:hypothetical protein
LRTSILSMILIVAASSLATAKAEPSQLNVPPRGFTALFNGKDLSGWCGMKTMDPRKFAAMSEEDRAAKVATDTKAAFEHWRAADGAIVNDGDGPYLTTDGEFGDMEFMIDYKTVAKADSGIYLRATPQVQIWDFTKEGGKWGTGADKGSGGLFNNRRSAPGRDPLVLADKPFGQWNRFQIRQLGTRTRVVLNDKLVVDDAILENYWDRDRKLPLIAKGPVQLQTHGGEIQWRNIFVREVPAEEANKILSQRDADGFVAIFNGRDLTGWTGAQDNYEVVDGAIRCKPGKGGNLYTENEYGDFIVRLEFKLSPGGNNGLAIRYPGKGNPAYNGMTELQVLDTEHPRYKSIDPRQAHGSVYGVVAAQRGYLRPTGEWNFQEVTVQGSKIKVELNGTVILDADIATVTDYMGGSKHPGKDLKKGHFGFAGHNDPIEFRNIAIKQLD